MEKVHQDSPGRVAGKWVGAMFCACAVLIGLLAGCSTVGPGSIERDRFDYSSAIAESWKQMMLLNIVKLRYGDAPVFLEVGSVVSQYSMETEVNAGATLSTGDILGDGVSVGGTGVYATKPTITYSPLTGKKFSKSLLSPIKPYDLFSLIQSGWSAELIMEVCVSAINDIYNTSGRSGIIQAEDIRFRQLIDSLVYIQQHGGLGARLISHSSGKSIVFFRRNMDPELERQVRSVSDLLGLDIKRREFKLVFGTTAADGSEIAVLTRSMLDIIMELAQYVEIPQLHLDEKRAVRVKKDNTLAAGENKTLIKIGSSQARPEDAFIAIQYKNHWFYIRDTDFSSKRIFSFLLFFFTLAESGPQGISPILTLPAG